MRTERATYGLVLLLLCVGTVSALDDTVFLGGRSDSLLFDPTVSIQPGGVQHFSFFYSDPSSNLQGFTITACFEGPLVALPGTFTIEGSILDDVDAEYVAMQADNSDDDGDGRQIIIGDVISGLLYFYQGGSQPAPPFPNPGHDVTESQSDSCWILGP